MPKATPATATRICMTDSVITTHVSCTVQDVDDSCGRLPVLGSVLLGSVLCERVPRQAGEFLPYWGVEGGCTAVLCA